MCEMKTILRDLTFCIVSWGKYCDSDKTSIKVNFVMEEEAPPESPPPKLPGEGAQLPGEVVITEKRLTFDEASKCLSHLGKDESGMRYAYLKLSVNDKKLTDVKIILNFRHLLFIDISGNYLNQQGIQVLTEMPFLIQLLAQRNFIESGNLYEMPYLQDLSLARNQIAMTVGLQQPFLEYLDLNYNQIYQVQLDTELLPNLKQLEVRGNFLFEVGGSLPETVERLYMPENRISRIIESEICKWTNLKILHLRNNMIRKLNGFSPALVNLRYLNLRQNKLNKMRQLRKLSYLPNLEILVILQNPVQGDNETKGEDDEDQMNEEYGGEDQDTVDPKRVAVLVLLPQLKRINKAPVSYDERAEAKRTYEEKYKEIMDEDSSDDELEAPTTTTTEYLTEPEADEEDFEN